MPVSASVIIDSFDDNPGYTVNAGSTTTVQTNNALGLFRTVGITESGGLGSTAVVNNNTFSHNAASGATAISTITWDANGAGLGGIDLLATDTLDFVGSTCFECFVLSIISIDQGGADFTFGLIDTNNISLGFTTVGVTGAGLFEVLFSNFVGIDLSSIDSISLEVSSTNASDLTLDFHGYTGSEAQAGTPPPALSVPVAPTAWLLLAGLVGFFSSRKNNAFEFSVSST